MCACVHLAVPACAKSVAASELNQLSDLIVAATSAGDNTFCCVDHTLPADFQGLMAGAGRSRFLVWFGLCHRQEDSLHSNPPSACQGFAGLSVVHTARLTTHITQPAAQNPKAGRGICG